MMNALLSQLAAHWWRFVGPLAVAWLLGLSSPVSASALSIKSNFLKETICANDLCFSSPGVYEINWNAGDSFCKERGGRIPTIDELQALYNVYPYNDIYVRFGWRTLYNYYWSSTAPVGPGEAIAVSLKTGITYGFDKESLRYLSCVI
ncbi:adhesion domain-containing protein [Aeromonas caviae]|uniref:adhesion domain-containing protein n=1 Tax=Aeromonas caviae TaxID=648 RepID=UPI0038D05335